MVITTDNASNNDTLIKMVEETCKSKHIEFFTYHNHVRCLAHVINLAAQDALAKLKVKYIESENETLNDSRERRNSKGKEPLLYVYKIDKF